MIDRILIRLRRLAAHLLLPSQVLGRHGKDMEQAFADMLRAARSGGTRRLLAVAGRELGDLVRAGRQAAGQRDVGARVGRAGGGGYPGKRGGGRTMESTWRDVRMALRGLRRRPGFTAAGMASLALGMGGTTAMFALVHGVLLRPLAFREPDRLAQAFLSVPSLGWDRGPVSFPVFADWRARAGGVFEGLAAFQTGARAAMLVEGERRLVSGAAVTGDMFTLLGREPLFGRVLQPADGGPGAEPVVLLSHALWLDAFGADATIVGRRIPLGDDAATVVGVMPRDFPGLTEREQYWVPFRRPPSDFERDMSFLHVVGRLRPGVDAAAATAAMERLTRELEREDPLGVEGRAARVVPQSSIVTESVRLQLLVLLGAVGLLLVIACANLAGLLLVRGAARARELAVREALGAGRSRLVRELLAESLLLAAGGALAAIPVAYALLGWVRSASGMTLPRLSEVGLDGPVLAFCAVVAGLSAAAFGVVPALRATRGRPAAGLGAAGAAGAGPSRLQRGLVVAQVAVATVLLVAAGLLGDSLRRLQDRELGFDPGGLITFRLSPPPTLSDEERSAFHARVLEGVSTLPGVGAAGATFALPLTGSYASSGLLVADRPTDKLTVETVSVLGGYLDAMRMRVLSGRALGPAEGASGTEVPILVGETLARRAWPGEDAVGKKLLDEEDGTVHATYRVVGVVADVVQRGPDEEPALVGYWPQAATPWAGDLFYAARTEGDPTRLAAAIREVVRRVDDRVPVADLSTMDARLDRTLAPPRFRASLTMLFALGAGCLSLLGIYGVTSFSVGRRTREIGVRLALGAERASVLGHVVRSGLVLATAGATLGLCGAAASARVVASLLYQVRPLEPAVYGLVAVAVLVTAGLASWVPARRAAAIPPTVALRVD